MSFCPSCGTQVEPGSRFCQKCGAAAAPPPATSAAPQPVAGPSARRGAPTALLLGAVAVVVVAVVGFALWAMFFRPLSEQDYESRAEEATFRILDASDELGTFADVWEYYDWDESFDDGDLADVREGFDEMASEMRAGYAELEGLRAPDSYEREHEALLSVTGYFSSDFLEQLDAAITEAEQGATKDELAEKYEDELEDMYREFGGIERDLGRMDDLPFVDDITDRLYEGL